MPFNDKTLYHLSQIQPRLAAIGFTFINALRAAGIPAYISSSLRTIAEQQRYVASGAAQTLNSKHLTGRAFDIDILGYRRDELPDWWWNQVGYYGEGLGLKWGGRWTFYDAGHFEV